MRPAGPLVFIVDDDASVRKSLERLMRTARLQVETFASADEFLERQTSGEPCCLVLDVRMPGPSSSCSRCSRRTGGQSPSCS